MEPSLRQLKSLDEPFSLKSVPVPGGTVDLLRGSGERPLPLPDSAYFLGESGDGGSVFLRV